MADYTLYYWPVPFRGQFVRAILEQAGADWAEAGFEAVAAQRQAEVQEQLVPHMGPPVLTDHAAGVTLSQLPAILGYLGLRLGMMPGDPASIAMTLKVIGDANDVLGDMTRDNGSQMWTPEDWAGFQPRLERWMRIFEETGRRSGSSAGAGWMLGTEAPGVADIVTAVLWGTMTDAFPSLRPMLERCAPAIAGLTDRVRALPAQAALRERSREDYGDSWCGGQIEASLRSVT